MKIYLGVKPLVVVCLQFINQCGFCQDNKAVKVQIIPEAMRATGMYVASVTSLDPSIGLIVLAKNNTKNANGCVVLNISKTEKRDDHLFESNRFKHINCG